MGGVDACHAFDLKATGVAVVGIEFIAGTDDLTSFCGANTNGDDDANAQTRSARSGVARSAPGVIADFLAKEPLGVRAAA